MLFNKLAIILSNGVKIGSSYAVSRKNLSRSIKALRSVGIMCEEDEKGRILITGIDRLNDGPIQACEITRAHSVLRDEHKEKLERIKARNEKIALDKANKTRSKIVRNATFFKFKLMTTGRCVFSGERNREEFTEWLANVGVVPYLNVAWRNNAGVTIAEFRVEVNNKTIEIAKDNVPYTSTTRKSKALTNKDKSFDKFDQ